MIPRFSRVCACVFQASLSIWGWGGLGVVLFLVTFGPFAIFYLAFYIFCFIGGWAEGRLGFHVNPSPGGSVSNCCLAPFCFPRGFAVTLLYGKINSERQLEQCEQSYLPPTQIGILKVMTGSRKQPHLTYKNMGMHLHVFTGTLNSHWVFLHFTFVTVSFCPVRRWMRWSWRSSPSRLTGDSQVPVSSMNRSNRSVCLLRKTSFL